MQSRPKVRLRGESRANRRRHPEGRAVTALPGGLCRLASPEAEPSACYKSELVCAAAGATSTFGVLNKSIRRRFERVKTATLRTSRSACGWPRAVIHVVSRVRVTVRPEGHVPGSRRTTGLLSGESWRLLTQPPRIALAKRLTLLSQGGGVPEGAPLESRRSEAPASRKRPTKPKFVQPEVWPTPAGRTDLRRMTKPRQRQHRFGADARAAAQVCCHPVIVGPRTDESVRLAVRTRHSRPD